MDNFITGAIFASGFIILGLWLYRDLILSHILDAYFKRPMGKNDYVTLSSFEKSITAIEKEINNRLNNITKDLNETTNKVASELQEAVYKQIITDVNKQLDVIYRHVDDEIKKKER